MTYVNERSVLAVGILFIILGILVVIARFYVRRKKAGFGLDDWLCIPALVLVIAECCIMIIGESCFAYFYAHNSLSVLSIGSTTNTVGSHSPAGIGFGAIFYNGADQITLEELEFPFDLMQITTLAILKLVILSFYRRIFRGRAFDIASWTLIGAVIAWAIAFFIAILAACGTHIRANFETLGVLKAECVNTFVVLVSLAVFDVAVDLAIIILPMPAIWALQMPVKHKIAVTGTFLVGALAIACGITRMAIFAAILGPALFSQSQVAGVASDDSIGIISILMFWGMLEMGVAMIAVCLPTLRPLFHGWSPESIMRSFRSALSLRSVGSRKRSYPSTTNPRERAESETSLGNVESVGYAAHTNYHQAYAMGPVTARQDGKDKMPNGEIYVRKALTQTVEGV